MSETELKTIEYALGGIQATLDSQRDSINETRIEQHNMSQKMDNFIAEVTNFKAQLEDFDTLQVDVDHLKDFRTFTKGVMVCVSAFAVIISFALNLPDRVVRSFSVAQVQVASPNTYKNMVKKD